ncbi:heptaprenyl diphosphate synthase component 1 [Paenibacillus lemnae]|uniref:Heptaprenyl diphosphate synthase component 1 n=1 Tax=Paenibacillus lemnae TaxID=1330551 RepID=A0A848M714_PAELE|nr:heptaprenyl diphosphate synthase component 1 [Paenibacillus lemnae]NMO96968.1 heptaprenyl diphosphate synthase component 1 [Paenibacillus lemnae]
MKPYRVPELAQKFFQYDMIQNHTELPDFPDARVHLLYIFMQYHSARSKPEREELYALAASLVQMGLDTHESIDTNAEHQKEEHMRSRQLKVLAGDYFSSRFYQLLARSGDIESIALLSRAVSEVNVMKMRLYSRMKEMLLPSEEYLGYMVQLNMQLFLSFTPMIDEASRDLWKHLLQEFTRCETILRELDRSTTPNHGAESYSYWSILEQGSEEEKSMLTKKTVDSRDWKDLIRRHRTVESLLDKLRQSVDCIQSSVTAWSGKGGAAHIGHLVQPFIQRLNQCRPAVREG